MVGGVIEVMTGSEWHVGHWVGRMQSVLESNSLAAHLMSAKLESQITLILCVDIFPNIQYSIES